MRKKRSLFLFMSFLLLCMTFLSGCGYKDIDKRYFVVNLGIDHHEGKAPYTLSIKIAVPSQEGAQPASDQSTVLSINTQSLSKGLEILKSRLDRELNFGHLKVLLVDPYVAKHDMKTITNWFIERNDIQKIAYIAIADPSAKAILSFTPTTEKMPSGTLLLQFGDTGSDSPYTNTQFLFSFYRDLNERGISAVLPIVEIYEDRLQIQKVGLFDNEKLVVTLSPEETLLLNSFVKHSVTNEMKMVIDDNQGVASFREIRTRINLRTTGETPTATIRVRAIGALGKPTRPFSTTNDEKEQTLVNQKLKKEITQLFQKLQKEKVDPIGFGLLYRAHHFDHSKDDETWNTLYSELKFKVEVNTTFKQNGISD